jgi:galactokinase
MASALAASDVADAASLLRESQRSLRDDMGVSTPEIDALVSALEAVPGVLAARLTGAGFGGCVVALTERDVTLAAARGGSLAHVRCLRVEPSDGARVAVTP